MPIKSCQTRQFQSLIKWINRLDMNAVFVAHQKDLWGLNDQKQREMIGYAADAQDKMEYDLHLSLRIAKVGTSRYAYIGKSRLPTFPEEICHSPGHTKTSPNVMGASSSRRRRTPSCWPTMPRSLRLNRLFVHREDAHEDWQDKVFKKNPVSEPGAGWTPTRRPR